jgi:hypothetical protein
MKYSSGEEAMLGDRVAIGRWSTGVVVCSIDRNEYSKNYPREHWSYLKRGVLVLTEAAGLIHYEDAEPDMELIARA